MGGPGPPGGGGVAVTPSPTGAQNGGERNFHIFYYLLDGLERRAADGAYMAAGASRPPVMTAHAALGRRVALQLDRSPLAYTYLNGGVSPFARHHRVCLASAGKLSSPLIAYPCLWH